MNNVALGIIITLVILLVIGAIAGVFIWAALQPGGISGVWSRLTGKSGQATPQLVVTFQDGRVQHVALRDNRVVSIGREPGNNVVIDNHLVSRLHARVFSENGRWMIEDNNSVNGVFLNRRLIAHRAVLSGSPSDIIEIGPAQIRLALPDASQSGQPASISTTGSYAVPVTGAQPGPAAITDNLSRQMFGRFVVVRSLGEGGMSRVVLAQDTERQQQLVAIKILHHPDGFLAEKFRQEGGLRLVHPHIVRIIETGELNERPYIVMEYVEGASLRHLLPERAMPLEVALAVIGQTLQALDYAHQRQIVHRDIKPSNLMISPQHGVKIIDFGIAKMLQSVTRTRDGLLLGTPQYMSYEQACAQPVIPASDVYSAGIVLYEMLTGKIPFSAENPMDVVRQHVEYKPMPPRRLNSSIPPHVEAAILQALEKDPDKRFASASEFFDALECVPDQPLPDSFVQEATRQNTPVYNERGNAVDLPTRIPPDMLSNGTPSRHLRVSSGPQQGQRLQVLQGLVVGREQIDRSDGTISRQHFSIEQHNGFCLLRDRSAHGTIVNQQRLKHGETCRLQHGAVIHIGQTTLIYEEQM